MAPPFYDVCREVKDDLHVERFAGTLALASRHDIQNLSGRAEFRRSQLIHRGLSLRDRE